MPASAAVAASAPRGRRPRRSGLAFDLTALALVGVLLIGAVVAGALSISQEFYSARAFVERYLGLLAERRAADALALPGVAVDSEELAAAGIGDHASDALLRQAALTSLTDVKVLSEEEAGDLTHVTVSYVAGGYPGTTTFDVERDGWIGIAPAWRFATSPLAVIDLTVRGSMKFDVNGFALDKRQVSPDGVNAVALAPLPMLVFSPGLYSVSVSTAIATTPGVAVLSDSPLTAVPIDVQAQPTAQFVEVVQERVDEFLTACAQQQVLQPTACPFGYRLEDRVVSPPTWSIAQSPTISVVPNGADWQIPATQAIAHIRVEVRSLFDGSLSEIDEDVAFDVSGTIEVLPDGTASIQVSGPGPS
ncbi:hypothetical protein F6B43_13605 [Microbacterium rhizomatis]|uniref:Uncharacterized protein n=1 Tax=Microbacterium rhizomatis TaxID=1631477 RepID=A0A5J5J205_9MICO|nr:hypothetical protein F6B43_13605 [Microbacterium rhizomatis]